MKFKIVKVYPYRTARVFHTIQCPRGIFKELEDQLRKMGQLDNHIVVVVENDTGCTHCQVAIWLSDFHAYVGDVENISETKNF